jgi:HK97 family phage major capsid protein
MATDLKDEMRAELVKARDISEKYQPGEEMSADDLGAVTTHIKAYQALKAQFEAATASDEVRKTISAFGAELGLEKNEGGQPTPTVFHQPTGKTGFKTLGQMYVESAEYKGLMAQFPSGNIGKEARVSSHPFGVKALLTGLSDTQGGAFITTDRQADVEMLGRRPLTIRDLVSKRTTTSDTVDFVQQTTQTAAAATVAEATSSAAPTTGASSGAALILNPGGGYKPEGTMAFQVVTANVKTIAEWIPATKRGLADASQLRGLIDQELRDDLAEEEEDQILNGNGTGENITGILNTSGIQTQALSSLVAGVDPKTETLLRAKTKVLTVGRSRPTGVVINPVDWEAITLARLAKNPANEGDGIAVERIHGMAVVQSEAMPAGTALVGDYRKAVIWDREQSSITATDSHADFFIRNLVAILAEERIAFGVLRPKAFVKATIV